MNYWMLDTVILLIVINVYRTLSLFLKNNSHYATAGGPYKTSRQGTVTLKLPEFSSSKEISW